ncbi:MAG TPA: amidohydrolase family protein [Acidobacteriota bacterium]|jgi:imidazolonepropionase-like amidohydrolase
MKNLWCAVLLVCAVSVSLSQQPAGETFVLTHVRLVTDGTVVADCSVVWRRDRIVAAGTNVAAPQNATVIDGTGKTVIPGLFDVHTHLNNSAGPDLRADWQKNLEAYLYYGITTVVDFSSNPEAYREVRQIAGKVPAPRLVLAARFTTPLGHGAEGGRDNASIEVQTPREARAAMEKLGPLQPDVLKIFTDGWRYGNAPDMSSMDQATLNSLVSMAHARGLEVLTHTVTVERAKIASRAGVDCIAHAASNTPVDEELIRLMQENKTGYAPTSAVYEPRQPPIDSAQLLDVMEPALLNSVKGPVRTDRSESSVPVDPRNPPGPSRGRRFEILKGNTLALYKAGIPIVLGTDSGVTGTFHGWASIHELELLCQSGLSPLEALMAGTRNAARVLRLDDRGSIASGKLADFILVAGRPDEDILDIWKMERVFLAGLEVNRKSLRDDIQRQEAHLPEIFKPVAQLDDFEAATGRTSIGTLWYGAYEAGHDHSRLSYARILRSSANHALSIQVKHAQRAEPFASVVLPMSAGMLRAADLSALSGLEFEARGEGDYSVALVTASERNGAYPVARFTANASWRKIRIPFHRFLTPIRSSRTETRLDLLAISFQIPGSPETTRWLELDNVQFMR